MIAREQDRLSPPLKQVFRASFAARDAKTKVDVRDQSGERVIAGRRGHARTAIGEQMLRGDVALDLEMLMNTVALGSSIDLADFANVQKSILNYGLPDIVVRTIDEGSVDAIRAEITTALRTYEPRLVAGTIKVERDTSFASADLRVRFVIQAELRCDPLAVPVEFVADVQVDTGACSIKGL